MLSFIKETEDIWQYLKRQEKPIVLYGMGDGAEKIYAQMEKCGIKLSGIFASPGRTRGNEFLGFTIKSFYQTQKELGDFITLVAFGTHNLEVMEMIDEFQDKTELLIPDVPIAGEEVFTLDFVRENEDRLEYAYSLFEDEISQRIFADLCNFKLSGKPEYLKYAHEVGITPPWELDDRETYIDVGAYTGDTLFDFINETRGFYNEIYALEPDSRNFKKLEAKVEALELENINCLNVAAWDCEETLQFTENQGRGSKLSKENKKTVDVQANSIDNILQGKPATLLKVDAEGSEEAILFGAQDLMQTYQPKLNISAYHRSKDLFALPSQILTINPAYQLFLRKDKCYPAWEILIYAK